MTVGTAEVSIADHITGMPHIEVYTPLSPVTSRGIA